LEKAKEPGFDGVMIMAKRPHLPPSHYDAEARKRLREKIESPGLEIPSLAGYVDFTAGVDRPMTPMVEVQPGVPFDKLWEMCVRGLKLASKKAAEFGVTIAVQNHHDIAVHHETLRWLLEEGGVKA